MNKHTYTVLVGADLEAHTLPADVLAARDAAVRFDNLAPLVEPPVPANLWDDLVSAAVAAHTSGQPMPDAHRTTSEAEQARTAWERQSQLLTEVGQRVTQAVDNRVTSSSTRIITDHLRPALAEVVAELTRLVELLPPSTTAQNVLGSPLPVRKAWLALESNATRYATLRRSWSALQVAQQSEHDTFSEFVEFANLEQLWPTYRSSMRAMNGSPAEPPWPADPAERLLWLAHQHAQFIVPTDVERDQLWWQHYGSGVQQMRANREALGGFRALGG